MRLQLLNPISLSPHLYLLDTQVIGTRRTYTRLEIFFDTSRGLSTFASLSTLVTENIFSSAMQTQTGAVAWILDDQQPAMYSWSLEAL